MTEPRDWRSHAACLGIADPDIFYPSIGGAAAANPALAVCADCPVRRDCLADALADPPWQDLGVRGGLTEQQRVNLRRRRRARA